MAMEVIADNRLGTIKMMSLDTFMLPGTPGNKQAYKKWKWR